MKEKIKQFLKWVAECKEDFYTAVDELLEIYCEEMKSTEVIENINGLDVINLN